MSKLALSGLVLGSAMAVTAAQAEPLTLTTDQMDTVSAGKMPMFIPFHKHARVDAKVRKGFLADANARTGTGTAASHPVAASAR